MAIRPTQPQRVDSVLDTAVKLSKASVVKVLPLSLLMALVSMPGSIYLFVKGGVDLSDPFGMIRLMLSPGYLLGEHRELYRHGAHRRSGVPQDGGNCQRRRHEHDGGAC